MVPLKLSKRYCGVAAGVQTKVEPGSGEAGVRVEKSSQEEKVGNNNSNTILSEVGTLLADSRRNE